MTQERYSPGKLVQARGREWIILPADHEGLIRLRPLTGAAADESAVFEPLEGQAMAWVEPERLAAYDFPPADRALIERLVARR